MSRVASDVPTTDRVIVEAIDQALPAVLQFAIMAGWMFYNSWELTLVTLAPLPIIGLITTIYSKRAEPRWRESSQASADLNALLHDNLAGIRQIKAKTVDFGASDAPLKDDELAKDGLVQFPTVIGGVVPVVNIKGITPGQIKMTGQVLGDDRAVAATWVAGRLVHRREGPVAAGDFSTGF